MKARVLATMALAAVLAAASAAPASAASTSQVITGQYLELVSTADTAVMANMLPGDEVVWTVSVSADAPEPGVVDVALSGTGELPLSVVVRACDVEWDDGLCTSGATLLRERATVALDGHSEHLLRFDAETAQHLRLDVSLAESSDAPRTCLLKLDEASLIDLRGGGLSSCRSVDRGSRGGAGRVGLASAAGGLRS